MEFRKVAVALMPKLEALELRPVLSPVFAKDAPEFCKPRVGRSEVPKFKRLNINDIPGHIKTPAPRTFARRKARRAAWPAIRRARTTASGPEADFEKPSIVIFTSSRPTFEKAMASALNLPSGSKSSGVKFKGQLATKRFRSAHFDVNEFKKKSNPIVNPNLELGVSPNPWCNSVQT